MAALHKITRTLCQLYATFVEISSRTKLATIKGSTEAERSCYATAIEMAATKARSAEERTEKHRKAHKLLQTWVSPEMWKVAVARAKSEQRTIANWLRLELTKILGVNE